MTTKTKWGQYNLPETEIFNRMWWVTAPWAHPIWHSYAIILMDLTTVADKQGVAMKLRPDVTHEIQVYAQDPSPDAPPPFMFPPKLLTPMNHGYQFTVESNEAAEQRVMDIVARIMAQTLSPDTDYRRVWDELFSDGMTLLVGSVVFRVEG